MHAKSLYYERVVTPVHSINAPDGSVITVETVTPQIAVEYLARNHPNNRNLKPRNLSRLIHAHNNERFVFNGMPIRFDAERRLIDGQHRLMMVVETGKPITAVIIRNMPIDVFDTLDQGGAQRTATDVLSGTQYASIVSSVAKMAITYEAKGDPCNRDYAMRITIPEVVERSRRDTRLSVAAHAYCNPPKGSNIRKLMTPSAFAFCFWLLSQVDEHDARGFLESIGTGSDLSQGDPRLALRRRLESNAFTRRGDVSLLDASSVIRMTIRAWNKWRSGVTMEKIVKVPAASSPFPCPE